MQNRWLVLVAAGISAATAGMTFPAAAQDNSGNAPGSSNASIASEVSQDSNSPWAGYGSLGLSLLPEYEGSNSYILMPYAEGRLNYNNYYARFEGGALRFNLIDSEQFHAGPLIGFRQQYIFRSQRKIPGTEVTVGRDQRQFPRHLQPIRDAIDQFSERQVPLNGTGLLIMHPDIGFECALVRCRNIAGYHRRRRKTTIHAQHQNRRNPYSVFQCPLVHDFRATPSGASRLL